MYGAGNAQEGGRMSELIKVYGPPTLGRVMEGNKVMLASGGPCMIVCDASKADAAVCQWEAQGVLQHRTFALDCLTCWGAA